MTDSFPRQLARTQRFSRGVPRSFQVSADGGRVAFLRGKDGADPVNCLWVLDVAAGRERLAVDPAMLPGSGGELPEQEKARRERAREEAGGIVAFATDAALGIATFTLGGQVHLADLEPAGTSAPGARVRALPASSPAIDPRPDPAGRQVAYVCEGALRVTDLASGEDRQLVGPDGVPRLTFGLAEFVAAEEMGRQRGYWWSPDGTALLVARVDETPVQRWHVADPANPERPVLPISYPAAGTRNADVSLLLAGLDGTAVPLEWDRGGFPYLAAVEWSQGSPLIAVQSRDQRRMLLLSADPGTGATEVLVDDRDPHWVDIVGGAPARTRGGRVIWAADAGGAKRLFAAAPEELKEGSAQPVTPSTMQVREIVDADGETVLFTASGPDPTQVGLWLAGPDGPRPVAAEPGVHSGRRAGGTTVVTSRCLASEGVAVRVLRDSPGPGTGPAATVAHIPSLAEQPALPEPDLDLFSAGVREIRTALLLPSWHRPGAAKLPVLLDPYGGPHSQRVLATRQAFLTSRWFAEQGFAVVVADGRGTPGRGPAWDRAVAGDLAGPALEDQVAALEAAAGRCADLDLGRVAIRGWSYGGYLAALAVLRRPDVFHAAVAGAPVTDLRLYDTHYSERYLGDPAADPAAYERCSLLADAARIARSREDAAGSGRAGHGHRPLMIIHGLADDNVVVAHTLRLSAALLAAGYPHTVLPLSGVTHMTPQETVAENLLLFQVDFLRQALGSRDRGAAGPGV